MHFGWCRNERPWITLNDHYAVNCTKHASVRAHHENLNEDRRILSVAKV